jgi:ketosteroid isomerase-like protein
LLLSASAITEASGSLNSKLIFGGTTHVHTHTTNHENESQAGRLCHFIFKGASMNTPTPLDAITQFFNAMNDGDLEAALNLYEPGASLIAQPGVVATGPSAIREALAGFVALKPTLVSEAHQLVEVNDVALYCSRWSLRGTDPAGNPVHLSGRSADILRRQPDGNWLILLDNPWGTEIVSE